MIEGVVRAGALTLTSMSTRLVYVSQIEMAESAVTHGTAFNPSFLTATLQQCQQFSDIMTSKYGFARTLHVIATAQSSNPAKARHAGKRLKALVDHVQYRSSPEFLKLLQDQKTSLQFSAWLDQLDEQAVLPHQLLPHADALEHELQTLTARFPASPAAYVILRHGKRLLENTGLFHHIELCLEVHIPSNFATEPLAIALRCTKSKAQQWQSVFEQFSRALTALPAAPVPVGTQVRVHVPTPEGVETACDEVERTCMCA